MYTLTPSSHTVPPHTLTHHTSQASPSHCPPHTLTSQATPSHCPPHSLTLAHITHPPSHPHTVPPHTLTLAHITHHKPQPLTAPITPSPPHISTHHTYITSSHCPPHSPRRLPSLPMSLVVKWRQQLLWPRSLQGGGEDVLECTLTYSIVPNYYMYRMYCVLWREVEVYPSHVQYRGRGYCTCDV